MKIYLLGILLIFLLSPPTTCLFSNQTVYNFRITGITEPNKIVLDSLGERFIVWNNNADIRMYYTNGTLICFGSFVRQIQRIIWPEDFAPIVLPYPGQDFYTIDLSSCQITKTYNLLKFANISSKSQIAEITFAKINEIPILAASTMGCLYPLDLNSISNSAIYTTLDPTLPRYGGSVYSNDLKNLYIVMIDSLTGTNYVRVWNTNQSTGKPFRQFQFSTSVVGMTASNDNKSIICVGSYMNSNVTNIYRFDNSGSPKIKASREKIGKAIAIGDGNVVVLFKNEEGTMEVIRAGDGKSIQNITYTTVTDFYDAAYKNKVLIILDGSGRVVTYSYEPDQDVQPIPDPVVPEQGFPLWIIFVSVGAGVVIVTAIVLFVLRKKIFKRSAGSIRSQKQSLISKQVASEYAYKPIEQKRQEPRRSMGHHGEERRQQDPRRSLLRGSQQQSVHGEQEPPVQVPPPVPAPKKSFRRVPEQQPQPKPQHQKPPKKNFFSVKNQVYDDGNSQFRKDVEKE